MARPPHRWRSGDGPWISALAALCWLPLFLSHRGTLEADTKQYLYLDPAGLLRMAPNLWNRRLGGGTVTHQFIGYLWPMGPFYRVTDLLGVPDWIAQRIWMGGISFLAALGAYVLFRTLWSDRRAAFVGGLVYGLSPFVLGQITGQSALLLPFCALPWLVLATRNALRRDPWLWAAVYALVVTTAGSLNGSSIFFVILGSMLWVPYAIWWERSVTLRRGLGVVLAMGLLTVVTQLWWMIAYRVDGTYGLPVLQITETVRETSSSASAIEALRGLGYWFFYGGDNQGPWLAGIAPVFTQNLAVLALSFATPLAAVLLGWWSRFRERLFFVGLVLTGMLISSVAYGGTHRSVVGRVFESASRSSGLVLSLRNSQRAVALTVLGLAGLAAAGVAGLLRRAPRLGTAAGVTVSALVLATFVAPWSHALLADRYTRPETVPAAWRDTAAFLDRHPGRALLVPGEDFASYRWGHTLDPVLVGLTRGEVTWRELQPMGGVAGADLLAALDHTLQDGTVDPATIAPVARALGVRYLVVANDLEIERYRIQRPELVMAALADPRSGLDLVRSFGPGYVTPERPAPVTDETSVRTARTLGSSLPQVAVFRVPGAAATPVAAQATGAEVVLHGDGAGFVATAAAGLPGLGTEAGPWLTAHELADWPAGRRIARRATTRHVVTDTNRKAQHRFTTLLENDGATQTPAGDPESGVPNDIDTTDANGSGTADQTTVTLRGAKSVRASGYGNVVSLLPEDRPVNAFDGDPRTAWRVDRTSFRPLMPGDPQTLTVDLGRAVAADAVTVVQAPWRPGTAPITAFDVVLDGARTFSVTVDAAAAFDPAGATVALDGRPFTTLEVRVPDDPASIGEIGIAEVAIPGVAVEELVHVPRSLARYGPRSGPIPLAFVLSRQRANASLVFRSDPEPTLRRLIDVPTTDTFTVGGVAHVSRRAPDAVLDAALGTLASGVTATSSGRNLGDPTARASAALDGDPTTAWVTPLTGAVGSSWTLTRTDTTIDADTVTLDLVADGRHSLPTSLDVTVDGVTRTVPVPAIGESDVPNAASRVTLAVPVHGHSVTLTVGAIDPRAGSDLSGNPVELPVAIAAVDLGPSTPTASTPATLDPGCRRDLLTIDDVAVPVRLVGTPGPDTAGNLTVSACDGPLRLTAGRHVVRTGDGFDLGVDLDVVSLTSSGFATAADPGAPPATRNATDRGATVTGRGAPYWVRLDQSANAGWKVTATHAGASTDLGPAHSLDLYAAGWLVERGTSGPTAFAVSWPPQRQVDVALAVSALGVLGCVVLILVRRRRSAALAAIPPVTTTPDWPAPATAWTTAGAVPWAVAGVAVIGSVLTAGPVVALAVAVAAVASRFAPRHRIVATAVRVVPLAALGAAVALVLARQVRNDYSHDALWPTQFRSAHLLVLFGVVTLVLGVWADRRIDTEPGTAEASS